MLSVGSPAGSMTHTTRGGCSFETSSSTSRVAVTLLLFSSFARASAFSVVRLNTNTWWPPRANLLAMFAPILPNPIIPISIFFLVTPPSINKHRILFPTRFLLARADRLSALRSWNLGCEGFQSALNVCPKIDPDHLPSPILKRLAVSKSFGEGESPKTQRGFGGTCLVGNRKIGLPLSLARKLDENSRTRVPLVLLSRRMKKSRAISKGRREFEMIPEGGPQPLKENVRFSAALKICLK